LAGFAARLTAAQGAPFSIQEGEFPTKLCHYTSMKGLKGILTGQVFRATDHHDVDDKGELRAAEDRVDAILKELRPKVPAPSAGLFDEFFNFYSTRRVADHVAAYLSCFTSMVDQLYHWASFAKNGGACLVLKFIPGENLPVMFRGFRLGRSAFPVVYDAKVWEERIRAGFLGVLREHEAFAETARIWKLEDVAREKTILELAVVAANAGISAKDPRYREEAEWRWIAVPETAPGRLPTEKSEPNEKGQQKRYLPLRFRPGTKRLEIDEVIVRGPDPTGAINEAHRILLEAGYPPTDLPNVRASEHPFGWAPGSAAARPGS
jgi:hypothetical protein